MSYQQAKRVPLSDKTWIFSGWFVDNCQNVDLEPQYSPYERNARLDWQSIIIRPWHQNLTTLTAGSYPKGIGSYLRANPSNDRIIVRHNQSATEKLVTIDDTGTDTAITTGSLIASDNRMTFNNVADVIYCLNWSDYLGKLSGTTYTTPSIKMYYLDSNWVTGKNDMSVTSSPLDIWFYELEIDATGSPDTFKRRKNGWAYTTGVAITWVTQAVWSSSVVFQSPAWTPSTTGHTLWDKRSWYTWGTPSFGVLFNSSYWVSGRSAVPNVVFKSVGNNYENFLKTGSDNFAFGETVTALAVNNQSLFYFTKNTISVTGSQDITETNGVFSYASSPLEVKEWAINNATTIETGNNIYYVTPSNSINMIRRGENIYWFDTVSLSDRKYKGISKIMSSLDADQSDSFGYFLPDVNLIKRHFKSVWSTFYDVCIVYDTIKDTFLVDWEKYFFDGINHKGKNYTVSMLEPKVFRDEYGQTDENSAIQFHYKTKEYYVTDPTFKKIVRETRTLLDINELAVLTQNILINWVSADSKTIWLSNYIDAWGWTDVGIGSWSVWDYAIWDESEDDDSWYMGDDDYVETYILRTKGDLNKKWYKFQFEFLCSSLAWKVRLKNIQSKFEILDWLATNLTL